jgi:hypothetical protein
VVREGVEHGAWTALYLDVSTRIHQGVQIGGNILSVEAGACHVFWHAPREEALASVTRVVNFMMME